MKSQALIALALIVVMHELASTEASCSSSTTIRRRPCGYGNGYGYGYGNEYGNGYELDYGYGYGLGNGGYGLGNGGYGYGLGGSYGAGYGYGYGYGFPGYGYPGYGYPGFPGCRCDCCGPRGYGAQSGLIAPFSNEVIEEDVPGDDAVAFDAV